MKSFKYANEWGADPVSPRQDPIPAYKFLTLHKPICEDFGGHHFLTGSYNQAYYGSDQVASCEYLNEWHKDPKGHEDQIKLHGSIPGKSTHEPGGCRCGIYSQTLSHTLNHMEYGEGNVFAKLDLMGKVRYTESGYRSSHVRVNKIWTSLSLDNDELSKAQQDLGIPIERVPVEHINNYGKPFWDKLINNTPEIHRDLQKEIPFLAEEDRKTAASSVPNGVCPNCQSKNLGLVNSVGNQAYRTGIQRAGRCLDCFNTWTR